MEIDLRPGYDRVLRALLRKGILSCLGVVTSPPYLVTTKLLVTTPVSRGCNLPVLSWQGLGHRIVEYCFKGEVDRQCEELVGWAGGLSVGRRFGPLSRYSLLRVKWTVSEMEAWWGLDGGCQWREAWSTFVVLYAHEPTKHHAYVSGTLRLLVAVL